jgi:hypothetical protein
MNNINDIMKVWKNTGGRTQTHCVPRTLDGEAGWTCKDQKDGWSWSSPERTCGVGGGISGGTVTCRPVETVGSRPYKMGKKWTNLYQQAQMVKIEYSYAH